MSSATTIDMQISCCPAGPHSPINKQERVLALNRKRESKKVRLLHMDCSCHAEHECVFSYHCCTAKIWHQSTLTCSPTRLPNYSILWCTYFPKVMPHGALCDITQRKRTVNKKRATTMCRNGQPNQQKIYELRLIISC